MASAHTSDRHGERSTFLDFFDEIFYQRMRRWHSQPRQEELIQPAHSGHERAFHVQNSNDVTRRRRRVAASGDIESSVGNPMSQLQKQKQKKKKKKKMRHAWISERPRYTFGAIAVVVVGA